MGHMAGDQCLRRVGDTLRSVYGRFGACYRIGGDEFCVILDRGDPEKLNRQFRAAIARLHEQDARMPDVALGYAHYHADTTHIQKVIEEADEMMYRDKAAQAAADRGKKGMN